MSGAPFSVRSERADHPVVQSMLAELDAYLASLYAPEDNHILDVEALLADDVVFRVAVCGDELMGCGAVRLMPGEPETGGQVYGEVKRMFVKPIFRGRRAAERLLSDLECALTERGVKLALLETGRDQHEAIRLYERCGYRRRVPFGGYPDNGLSVFYAKQLAP
jgi:putative acetyltransferase